MSALQTVGLYLLTFNCGRTLIKPEVFATHFFDGLPDPTSHTEPPALVVLHLQEIAPLADGFNGYALSKYYDHFATALRLAVKQRFPHYSSTDGDDGEDTYVSFTTGNAGITAIMLFVRSDVQDRVKDIMLADVGVGVQRMGNKGAAGVRVAWRTNTGNASRATDIVNLTFVSAHLAPMEEALERRNQDFHDIVAGLVFEPLHASRLSSKNRVDGRETDPLLSSPDSNGEDEEVDNDNTSNSDPMIGMYTPDAHVFFSGDLNYRTSTTRPVHDGSDTQSFPQPVPSPSSPKHYSHLLSRDQLTQQLRAGKTLHGFTEHPIDFPPTYKYSSDACGDSDVMLDSEVSEWKWSTHRWPSWCDRILYSSSSSSSSSNTAVSVDKYTALPLFATSDHRPVALSASVPLHPVTNPDFAAKRPVDLDPNWRANRNAARLKEVIVGTAWSTVSTVDGMVNLTMGIAAVVCFAVLATVYAREW